MRYGKIPSSDSLQQNLQDKMAAKITDKQKQKTGRQPRQGRRPAPTVYPPADQKNQK